MSDPAAAETTTKTPFWRWPGMWVKDEKFWMDVATRTVAGILAAGFIYIFAIVAGYLQSPGFWTTLQSLATTILYSAVLLLMIAILIFGLRAVDKAVLKRMAKVKAEKLQENN